MRVLIYFLKPKRTVFFYLKYFIGYFKENFIISSKNLIFNINFCNNFFINPDLEKIKIMNLLKLMVLMYQYGYIDTLTLIEFWSNFIAQYGSIVVAEIASYILKVKPSVLISSIAGLSTNYKYIDKGILRYQFVPHLLIYLIAR